LIVDKDEFRQKLIDSKQRWAAEGRLITGTTAKRGADRLPPGQHVVKTWPVLDLGVQPKVEPWEWALTVDGLVGKAVTWTFQDFLAQPQVQSTSDIHCVTAWSRYDNRWEGVATAHILAVVQPLERARHIVCYSHDGYTTNLKLEDFADADALLAYKWEGQPLTREHGGPVRAIVPKLYFWKSAKWLKRLEFVARDKPGFWEERGYHNEGDPWQEQRYG
jgi:DMSO/TMAO reductase YedYZ molybdopterin-dependent catalytic subunit